MARRNTLAFAVACLLGAPQLASSHTWVEQLNRVAANGTLVGPVGFSNGWTGRLDGFSDPKFTNRIPNDGFTMCKQGLQGAQSPDFPLLTAAPGDFVSMRYQENGHVTKPDTPPGKPLNRGTVFVYGTTEPKAADTLFDVHRQWTADGKGGDGRGRLLATRNYDDGQCYQMNDSPISKQRQSEFAHTTAQPMGPDVWCQSAVQLPEDVAQNSDYTLYWVWSWPTLTTAAAANSKDGQYADFPSGFKGDKRAVTSDDVTVAEIYTSCSTIKVKGEALVKGAKAASTSNKSANQNANSLAAFNFPEKTNYNDNAVKEQLQNQFLVDVKGSTPGNSAPGNGTARNGTEKVLSSAAPSAPATTPTPTGGNVRYVTVTAAPVTLYSKITVTVGPQPTPTPSNNPNKAVDGAAKPSVSPFMKPGVKGRHIRGKDSWNFEKRI
ncbi:hypothetical protein CkaCkLH20_06825 [Colletotrichum karsti]|uniref:DUF7492 domain-containing protein n=1 Tax=Colletotrichum karsti TaxID=1095194 RepID=A0A9P6LJP6_9PEZI|nr:uncharacterized protein CkaCkLH20_06825 [Colletotrichum karsti]KAF9875893.1 hypothetical protein CkaCkLH20_06825 [Colletotrichum karsti]